jgi:hypothetical protein
MLTYAYVGSGEVNPWLVPASKKIQAPQKGQKKMVGDDGKQVQLN